MNSIEVGKRLVALTRSDNDAQALDELYADSVVSIEASAEAGSDAQVFEGIEAVRGKHAWWDSVATMHDTTAEGPFAALNEDQFVVRFWMDVTMEGQERAQLTEVGLFTVEGGKIVREVYLPLNESG